MDACRKARNTELYTTCDVADDRRAKMAAIHDPRVTYRDYNEMLDHGSHLVDIARFLGGTDRGTGPAEFYTGCGKSRWPEV